MLTALKQQTNVKAYSSITTRVRPLMAQEGGLRYEIVVKGGAIPIKEIPVHLTLRGVDADTLGRRAPAGPVVRDPIRANRPMRSVERPRSPATVYCWRKRYGALTLPAAQEFRELQWENRRLRSLVATLTARLAALAPVRMGSEAAAVVKPELPIRALDPITLRTGESLGRFAAVRGSHSLSSGKHQAGLRVRVPS